MKKMQNKKIMALGTIIIMVFSMFSTVLAKELKTSLKIVKQASEIKYLENDQGHISKTILDSNANIGEVTIELKLSNTKKETTKNTDTEIILVIDNSGSMDCQTTDGKTRKQIFDEGLIDPEAFTQEWSTYVAKGKSGRYGVCFSWDVGNIDNLKDWVPLPALTADTRNITPTNGSFTSGFERGRCVVTSVAENPALVCAWLDQMYAPIQSPQNNWGTYGD